MTLTRCAGRFLGFLALVGVLAGCGGAGGGGGGANGDTRPTLDAAKVPEGLRELTPLAQRWGISDDLERGEALSRSTASERAELRVAVHAHAAEITAWLDSFGGGGNMSEEAVAFMYMQLAVEELPD